MMTRLTAIFLVLACSGCVAVEIVPTPVAPSNPESLPAQSGDPSPTLGGATPRATSRSSASAGPSLTAEPVAAVGTILFGDGYDAATLRIPNPRSTFRLRERVAWVAAVGPAENSSLGLMIFGSREATISRDSSDIDRNGDLVAESMHLGRILREPGAYILRYVDGGTQDVIAEGQFVLTP